MPQINSRKAKAALRKPAGLTVTKATRDARRLVDRIMPSVGATVESKLSHDLATDTPTVTTVVTFPHMHPAISELRFALDQLAKRDIKTDPSRITITRTR